MSSPQEYMYNQNHKIVTKTITKIGFVISGAQNTEDFFNFLKKRYRDNETIKIEVDSDWVKGYFKVIVTCPNVTCLMGVVYSATEKFSNNENFYYNEPFLIEESWA